MAAVKIHTDETPITNPPNEPLIAVINRIAGRAPNNRSKTNQPIAAHVVWIMTLMNGNADRCKPNTWMSRQQNV